MTVLAVSTGCVTMAAIMPAKQAPVILDASGELEKVVVCCRCAVTTGDKPK